MRASTSTRHQVSGNRVVHNSSSLPNLNGRKTKNSIKAAKPLSPKSDPAVNVSTAEFSDSVTHPPTPFQVNGDNVPVVVVDPPTHPGLSEPLVLENTPVRQRKIST